MVKKLGIALSGLLFYLFYLAIAFAWTGGVKRTYAVLEERGKSGFGEGMPWVAQIAEAFKPSMYLDPADASPPLLHFTYEAIDNGPYLTLVYYAVWADEHHPHPVVDVLYKAYRFFRYGLTLKDIEFIQIDIEKKTGKMFRAKFETHKPGNSFNTPSQEHLLCVLEKDGQGTYTATVQDYPGKVYDTKEGLSMPDGRLHVRASTWNHLVEPVSEVAGLKPCQAGLVYLTDGLYVSYRYGRRGAGDFKTVESQATGYIIFFIGLIFLFYFVSLSANTAKIQKPLSGKNKTH